MRWCLVQWDVISCNSAIAACRAAWATALGFIDLGLQLSPVSYNALGSVVQWEHGTQLLAAWRDFQCAERGVDGTESAAH